MSLHQEVDLSKLRNAHPPSAVARRIVEGAMARIEPQRSRGGLVAVPVVFAAGVAAAVVFLRPAPQPQIVVVAPQMPEVPQVTALSTGQVALAAQAGTLFRAGRHQIKVEPNGKVVATKIVPRGVHLQVAAGAARFEVQPLEADEVFSVRAGSITVEAVGTQFEVEVEGDCTRVDVSEGIIRVSREGRELELVSEGKRGTFCEGAGDPEAFSEEERLLSDALDKVRAGSNADLARAVEFLRTYIEKYPSGVYQQEALYYLSRLNARLGRADEAKTWTAKFLERWPTGRRADELRALSAGK